MTVIVDASVVVAALVDSGRAGRWAESVLAEGELVAPELLLAEASNVLRRLERAKKISRLEANSSQRDLLLLDLALFPYAPLADRIWDLRDNLTSYDAWYVALAEAFDAPFATLDRNLSRVKRAGCRFIVPPV